LIPLLKQAAFANSSIIHTQLNYQNGHHYFRCLIPVDASVFSMRQAIIRTLWSCFQLLSGGCPHKLHFGMFGCAFYSRLSLMNFSLNYRIGISLQRSAFRFSYCRFPQHPIRFLKVEARYQFQCNAMRVTVQEVSWIHEDADQAFLLQLGFVFLVTSSDWVTRVSEACDQYFSSKASHELFSCL
jgi:hypothetical protein